MTLNASGPISIGGTTTGQSVEIELGENGTTLMTMNDTNFRTLAGVPSGAISLSNLYSKSNKTPSVNYLIVAGGGSGGGAIGAGGGGGGGGKGAGNGSVCVAGTNGLGGGGGGDTSGSTNVAGGSGVVIISYPSTYSAPASTTGSPTVTSSGGYQIYTWTTSGSITF